MYVEQLLHGYKKGHQLLAGSVQLDSQTAELITQLSDLSGSITSETELRPYLTCYHVPNTQYYALAKTWPDPFASRAGCVLTHTLLIPLNVWGNCPNPYEFNRLFNQPRMRDEIELYQNKINFEYNNSSEAFNNFHTNRSLLLGFIYRFFGEGIKPIVWFDENDPEVIFWMLSRAFWPRLRTEFSCCTFCLQPRYLNENLFDLMFVPASAYTRFQQISLESVLDRTNQMNFLNSQKEKSEPWIKEWTDYILEGPNYLNDLQNEFTELGPLLNEDPMSIKKVYLIQELHKRSKSSPLAGVGWMDIVKSLAPNETEALAYKQNTIANVIQSISQFRDLNANDALKCLSLLGDRLNRPAYRKISAKEINKYFEVLALYIKQDPKMALSIAEKENKTINEMYESYYEKGLLFGLEMLGEIQPSELSVLHEYPEISKALIAIDPRLSLLYLRSEKTDVGPRTSIQDLVLWLSEISDSGKRENLYKVLLPEIKDDSYYLLAEELLIMLKENDVIWALNTLYTSTNGFTTKGIKKIICERVSSIHKLCVQQWASQTNRWSVEAASIVGATYALNRNGLLELVQSMQYNRLKKAQIIASLITKLAQNRPLPNWFLEFASSNKDLLQGLLLTDEFMPEDVVQAIQILIDSSIVLPIVRVCGTPEIDDLVSSKKYSFSAGLVSSTMQSVITEYIAGDIDLNNYRMWESTSWGKKWLREVNSKELQSVLRDKCFENQDTWTNCWKWLAVVTDVLYQPSTFTPIELINFLISYRNKNWSPEVIDFWVVILERIQTHSKRIIYLQACANALDYAFRNRHNQLSKIVIKSFQPVHKAMINSEEIPETYNLFGFFSWDKAKELRKKLISSFMDSSWPPGDLALASREKPLLRKIYSRLKRQWNGADYIRIIMNDLRQRGEQDLEVVQVLNELTSFTHQKNFYEDWD